MIIARASEDRTLSGGDLLLPVATSTSPLPDEVADPGHRPMCLFHIDARTPNDQPVSHTYLIDLDRATGIIAGLCTEMADQGVDPPRLARLLSTRIAAMGAVTDTGTMVAVLPDEPTVPS